MPDAEEIEQTPILPRVGITRPQYTRGLVIAYTPWQTQEENGSYPNGVALCVLIGNELHPYVVWTLYTGDKGDTWDAEGGTYCVTIQQAVDAYARRGGV